MQKRRRLLLRSTLSPPGITLLRDGELSTLTLRQGDPWLRPLTDNEDVGNTKKTSLRLVLVSEGSKNLPGSEGSVEDILHVYNIETTNVLLTVNDNTCTTHVTTARNHDNVASVKLDKIGDLALFKVELDSVVDLDERVRVTDCATVVRDNIGNTLGANGHFADLEELVGSLLGGDTVNRETALDVVQESEVLAGLLNGDNI